MGADLVIQLSLFRRAWRIQHIDNSPPRLNVLRTVAAVVGLALGVNGLPMLPFAPLRTERAEASHGAEASTDYDALDPVRYQDGKSTAISNPMLRWDTAWAAFRWHRNVTNCGWASATETINEQLRGLNADGSANSGWSLRAQWGPAAWDCGDFSGNQIDQTWYRSTPHAEVRYVGATSGTVYMRASTLTRFVAAAPFPSNLTPADGASFATSTPALSATFEDPNAGDDGHVEFAVYQGTNLVATNAAAPGPLVQPGQTVTWQVPGGILQSGETYTWRARAADGVQHSEWSLPRAISIGGASLHLRQWSSDPSSGRVDYDFSATASGLNAGGDVAGPCFQLECSWRVETKYADGTAEKGYGVLASESLPSGTASLQHPVTGTHWMEITHIKTIVEPGPCYGCVQTRKTYDSGWKKVANPYPTGDVSLNVNLWKRDADTGVVTHDLAVGAKGASQFGGPCAEKGCQWKIEALHGDGTTTRLGAEQLPGGTWAFTKTITGTTSGTITHLKATLESMCDVNMEYWCWEPRETFTTGLVPVSDYIYKGQDLAAAAVALKPVLTRNPTFFCVRFLERAGTHRLRSTLSDQYIACELAVIAAESTIITVLQSIADAPGPARYDDFLPEPFPAPDPSMVPPVREDWEDETGCEQDIPQSSIDDQEIHVEQRHGYLAPPELEASKWEFDVPWKLLVRPHAMNYKATEQGPEYPGRCQRAIRYITDVGYEWITASREFRITDEYTVITLKGTGEFITAFPGRPWSEQP